MLTLVSSQSQDQAQDNTLDDLLVEQMNHVRFIRWHIEPLVSDTQDKKIGRLLNKINDHRYYYNDKSIVDFYDALKAVKSLRVKKDIRPVLTKYIQAVIDYLIILDEACFKPTLTIIQGGNPEESAGLKQIRKNMSDFKNRQMRMKSHRNTKIGRNGRAY